MLGKIILFSNLIRPTTDSGVQYDKSMARRGGFAGVGEVCPGVN